MGGPLVKTSKNTPARSNPSRSEQARWWLEDSLRQSVHQARKQPKRAGTNLLRVGSFLLGVSTQGVAMPPGPITGEPADGGSIGRPLRQSTPSGPNIPGFRLGDVPMRDVDGSQHSVKYGTFVDGHRTIQDAASRPKPPIMMLDRNLVVRWLDQNSWMKSIDRIFTRIGRSYTRWLPMRAVGGIGGTVGILLIPGLAEAAEAYATVGGATGIQSFFIAQRARLALAGQGGLVALAGVGGYLVGTYLDRKYGWSDFIAYDLTGLGDHLAALNALNGGRTNVRGAPPFLPPRRSIRLFQEVIEDQVDNGSRHGVADGSSNSKQKVRWNANHPRCVDHTVRPGETLQSIALKYYSDPKMWRWVYERAHEEIRESLGPNDPLTPGIRITVYAPDAVYVTCVSP